MPRFADDDSAIRSLVESLTAAVRAKDVDTLLSHCAPDIASFDMVPPLRHQGPEAMRALWARALAGFSGPVEYEVHQLEVVQHGGVAFTRSLNRFGGTGNEGRRRVNWVCSTLGLRKIEGTWKLVHLHSSVPIDMDSGRALLELIP